MTYDMWQQFLHLIGQECGSRVVETWFKAITLHSWDAQTKIVYLEAPNAFVKEWVQKKYLSVMQLHIGRLLHADNPRIVFIENTASNSTDVVKTVPELPTKIVPARVAPLSNYVDKGRRNYQVNKNHLFETFVVGPSNSLAYAAAHAVTERPGKLYNPLFIYGESGLGKTHLLHAIGNAIKTRNKNAVVLYQTADRFVTEFINAIRFDKVHQFKEKYHLIDVLLIDDIQFISNKEQTQEAFFHIFNSLYEAHKQIVFSSDTFPLDMNGVAERLQSRLASGLVTDIHIPSFETKMAIIKKKAIIHGQEFSDEVAHFIASHVVSNVRELEGALLRVTAFASLMQQNVSLDLAQKVLKRSKAPAIAKPVGIEAIVRVVCNHYSCTFEDLKSKSRNQEITHARHVTMFLIKQVTGKSLRAIGEFLGGRDHSTIINGLDRVAKNMADSTNFKSLIEQMELDVRNNVGG